MDRLKMMFATHPAPASDAGEQALEAVSAAAQCSLVCTTCADACLDETMDGLEECIRLNQDCAEICGAVARMLARPGHQDRETLERLLDGCIRACRACGEECGRHAGAMEHCRVCAETCEACADACAAMREALVA